MISYFNIDISRIPKELNMIFEIISKNNCKENNLKIDDTTSAIDWKLFLDLAFHHRVYPILYSRLKNMDEKVVPSFVTQFLYQQYKINTLQMLQLSSEIEHIDNIFKDNNIKSLFLKGPFLSKELYGDLSLRPSSDIDILVPINELVSVNKILLDNGYIHEAELHTVLGDWKWRHHHREYFNNEKGIKVEIHWRLNPGPGKEPSFNEMWERKRISKISSKTVNYLGKEDLFLFLVCHGARHGWSRIRWLVDIDKIIRNDLDWVLLLKLLKRFNYVHIAGQAIILSSAHLNTPIPKEVNMLKIGKRAKKLAEAASFYFENMVNIHSPPVPKNIAIYHRNHLFSLMSFQQKFLFGISCMYPYPTDVETLPLPERFHFLYFVLRPFLWVWRKTKHATT